MNYEDFIRKQPEVITIRLYRLDDGWKVEVVTPGGPGYAPKVFEGALAGLEASGEAAKNKLMEFLRELRGKVLTLESEGR